MDPQTDFVALYDSVNSAVPGGAMAIVSVVACWLVGVFRRDWLQKRLPPSWQWQNWPLAQRFAVGFAAGMACGTLTNVAAGKSWTMAALLGVGAGVGGVFTDNAQNAIKTFLPPKSYEPKLSTLRDPPMP